MTKWLIRNGTRLVLELMASLARVRGPAAPASQRLIDAAGRGVARLRAVTASSDPAQLGATWQRAFGAKKQVPIISTSDTTAYAEIRTPCPLRGSGDVQACYRMMGYDRAFMERAGARFVVLRSQAEPGVTVCQVAIRSAALSVDDLIPAHRREK